jgi:hypothetical protein
MGAAPGFHISPDFFGNLASGADPVYFTEWFYHKFPMDLPIDDALPLNAPERSASFHQERLPDKSAACKGQGVSPLQVAHLRRSGGELYIQHLTMAPFIFDHILSPLLFSVLYTPK